jgi:hypothetical protein
MSFPKDIYYFASGSTRERRTYGAEERHTLDGWHYYCIYGVSLRPDGADLPIQNDPWIYKGRALRPKDADMDFDRDARIEALNKTGWWVGEVTFALTGGPAPLDMYNKIYDLEPAGSLSPAAKQVARELDKLL